MRKNLLFLLVRPFYSHNGWVKYGDTFEIWKINEFEFQLVHNLKKADIILIPYPINYYYRNSKMNLIRCYDNLCDKYNIRAFGYISGDGGMQYPEFRNITYFRMGGNRSKLSAKNRGMPAALTDQYKKLYGTEKIIFRKKKSKPVVGFCGHATSSPLIYLYQNYKYLMENFKRFINDFNRRDYEPIFPSAFMRHRVMKYVEQENMIITNFIYRKKYRAGAKSQKDLQSTTLEYYENLLDSDYILCIRGAGNFSIRLYETLMVGRIPIFVNTDCILPFEEQIKWKSHAVWVEWDQIKYINEIILDFHNQLTAKNFYDLQAENRNLWATRLQPFSILQNL